MAIAPNENPAPGQGEHNYVCDSCGFSSIGHLSEDAASERGTEHESEHFKEKLAVKLKEDK